MQLLCNAVQATLFFLLLTYFWWGQILHPGTSSQKADVAFLLLLLLSA